MFSTLLLSGSLVLNVALGLKLRRLSADLQSPRKGGVQLGRVVQSVDVLTVEGGTTKLAIAGSEGLVLYVISPVCPYCEQDCNNIRSIAAKKQKTRFVGLSTQGRNLDTFLRGCQLPFPVYVASSSSLADPSDLNVTPQTIVFSSEGAVLRNWVGMLTGERMREAMSFFKIAEN